MIKHRLESYPDSAKPSVLPTSSSILTCLFPFLTFEEASDEVQCVTQRSNTRKGRPFCCVRALDDSEVKKSCMIFNSLARPSMAVD